MINCYNHFHLCHLDSLYPFSLFLFVCEKKITALFKPTQSAMLCLVFCSLSWLKGNMITFTGFKCIIMVFKWILNPSQWSYYGFLVQSFISLCDKFTFSCLPHLCIPSPSLLPISLKKMKQWGKNFNSLYLLIVIWIYLISL